MVQVDRRIMGDSYVSTHRQELPNSDVMIGQYCLVADVNVPFGKRIAIGAAELLAESIRAGRVPSPDTVGTWYHWQ